MSCNNTEHQINFTIPEASVDSTFQSPIIENDNRSNNTDKGRNFFQHRGIHLANLNISNIRPKLDELKILDILGVCETFLNKSIDETLLHIDRFSFERKDMDTRNEIEANNGGGVMIYILILDKIDYKRRFDLETPDVESIWVEILSPFFSAQCTDLRHPMQNEQTNFLYKLKIHSCKKLKYI